MTFCDCCLCPHAGVQAPVNGGMFMGHQYIYHPVICSLFQNRKRAVGISKHSPSSQYFNSLSHSAFHLYTDPRDHANALLERFMQ